MKLREVLQLIDGKVLTRNTDLDLEVKMGCGADLMSDVLAFTHEGTLLMSGLTNPQVVRTAEMAGIQAIVFVRGKNPPAGDHRAGGREGHRPAGLQVHHV
jgi:hypothetical protein